ncbi:MAG: choice-of-anchor J domain-containing protein, partial [Bacteroidales bacterium]
MKRISLSLLTAGLFLSLLLGSTGYLSAQPPQKNQLQKELKQMRATSPIGSEPSLSLHYLGRTPSQNVAKTNAHPTKATVILSISTQALGFSGYQMLLDSTHTTYGTTIPLDGLRVSKTNLSDSIYRLFSSCLPKNANGSVEACYAVKPGMSDTTYITPGLYDFCIMYPKTNKYQYGFWLVNSYWAAQDNFTFEAGYTYSFEVENTNSINFTPPFDLAATKLLVPANGLLSNKEAIGIEVYNYSSEVEIPNYTLSYSINNASPITESINTPLAPKATKTYTFNTKADLSNPGLYFIKAWVSYDKDLQKNNDSISSYCKHTPIFSLPFAQNFSQEEDFYASWNVLDANADGNTWTLSTYPGFDGTYEMNYNGMGCPNDADDYLISEGILLPQKDLHLSFDHRTDYDQAFGNIRVLYGTSPEPAKMKVLMSLDSLHNTDIEKKVLNFTNDSAGTYYFAFHLHSPANENYFYLDNIVIDTGDYTGVPNIELIDMNFPLSSCNVENPSSIEIKIANIGDEDIIKYNVHLTINDSISIEDNFSFLAAGDTTSITLYPYPALDFSTKGLYKISAYVTAPRDVDPLNDSLTLRIKHYEPLTQLPFISYFNSLENADNWYSTKPLSGAWVYDADYTTYEGYIDSVPLVSRCVQLEPGTYRVHLVYSAGMNLMGYIAYENILVSTGLSNTNPMSWAPFMNLEKQIGKKLEANANFTIKESGQYAIAIMSTDTDGLGMGLTSIWGIELEKVQDHDLLMQKFESESITLMTPIDQIEGEQSFSALAINYGLYPENKIALEVKLGSTVFATNKPSNDTLLPNDTLFLRAKGILPAGNKVGDSVTLTTTLTMNNLDSKTENNSSTFSFIITDSVFARDQVSNYNNGIGAKSPIAFGNIFVLSKADTLTAIKLAFIYSPIDQVGQFSLYALNSNGSLGSKLIEKEFRRITDSGIITVNVPARILEPGMYYFEIKQNTVNNIGLACDMKPDGFFYATNNTTLLKVKGYGNMFLRAIFGHSGKMIAHDAGVSQILQPKEVGVFSINEPIQVRITNYGSETLKELPIHCAINGSELPVFICDSLPAYSDLKVMFTANLSKTGNYKIKVWTSVNKDQNRENDTCEKEITCVVTPSAYRLNFEYCADFAINNFIPAWTTLDIDKIPTSRLQTYTFPHAGEAFAFINFNPLLTSPSIDAFPELAPIEGKYYGASFASGSAQKNDWLISPKLKMGDSTQLELWVKSCLGDVDLEKYNILVSQTDATPSSFKLIGEERVASDKKWEKVIVDLQAYNHKEIYVAIQCVSQGSFIFMVDDIFINTHFGTNVEKTESMDMIKLYPNPAKDFIYISSPAAPILSMEVYQISGREVYRSE